jgi:demethoxyubiquinone hydroxylase (CLK1/Coq7/Cat5 family)
VETAASRAALIGVLQAAYSGELAAAYAYRGHWRSLWRDKRRSARAEIMRIEEAEWHHRNLIGIMLEELGARPQRWREAVMWTIGRFFGALCFVSGFFGPMYAAGRLEASNVDQYVDARRHALACGFARYAAQLVDMVEEEARHERFFGDQVRGHLLLPVARLVGRWSPPPAALPEEIGPSAMQQQVAAGEDL